MDPHRFVAAGALLGLLFAASNAGKSLDQIQRERLSDQDDEPRFTRDRGGPGVGAQVTASAGTLGRGTGIVGR